MWKRGCRIMAISAKGGNCELLYVAIGVRRNHYLGNIATEQEHLRNIRSDYQRRGSAEDMVACRTKSLSAMSIWSNVFGNDGVFACSSPQARLVVNDIKSEFT